MSRVSREYVEELEEKIEDLEKQLENQTRYLVTPEVCGMWGCYGGEPTLNGKIEAIAAHLGVSFEVQPERVATTPAKVKTVKKGKK